MMQSPFILSLSPPIPTSPPFYNNHPPPFSHHLHLATVLASPKPPVAPLHQKDFVPLHSKNPSAIYRHIQRLAHRNQLHRALSALDHLDRRGVPVNVTTFSALLSACSRTRSLAEGRQLHAHIRTNGLQRNEFLLAQLARMYAACGSPDDARRVFDGTELHRSPYHWNSLLRGNVEGGGRWDSGVLEVFDEMREADVNANEYSFSCLMKSLSRSPSVIRGGMAHALMIKNGLLDSSVRLRTSLIDVYFKCCKVRHALKVFDEMTERDVVVWGAVIAGFAHNWKRREALEYFRWMVSEGIEPNSVVITTLLPVIGELAEQRLGREVHGFVMKHYRDYTRKMFIMSGLIDMYAKCGDMMSTRRVLYACKKRNTILWTALISGYSSNGRLEQALRSVIWMQQEGIKPDVVSVATALPVCTKLRALKSGKELHAYALKHGFLPNISITTSLMTMYSSCGHVVYSREMFEGLERKNAIAWTAMMDSFLRNNCPSDALGIFRLMLLSKHRPDSVAMARSLSASAKWGSVLLGKEIHGQILRRKLEGVPFVSAEIISMYGMCGDIALSRRVFDQVVSKGSLTWTSIIDAYGNNGLYAEAVQLFEQMLSDGFIPNLFTFDLMLSICEKGRLPDEALKVYGLMVHTHKLKASVEHYDSIIDLLSLSNRYDEAQRFARLRPLTLS